MYVRNTFYIIKNGIMPYKYRKVAFIDTQTITLPGTT